MIPSFLSLEILMSHGLVYVQAIVRVCKRVLCMLRDSFASVFEVFFLKNARACVCACAHGSACLLLLHFPLHLCSFLFHFFKPA